MRDTQPPELTAKMTEKLSAYWKLVDEIDALEQCIRKEKTKKATVSERIFEKVVSGYETNLKGLTDALDPLKIEIETFPRTSASLERPGPELSKSAPRPEIEASSC